MLFVGCVEYDLRVAMFYEPNEEPHLGGRIILDRLAREFSLTSGQEFSGPNTKTIFASTVTRDRGSLGRRHIDDKRRRPRPKSTSVLGKTTRITSRDEERSMASPSASATYCLLGGLSSSSSLCVQLLAQKASLLALWSWAGEHWHPCIVFLTRTLARVSENLWDRRVVGRRTPGAPR